MSNARDQILARVKANQPKDERPLPDLSSFPARTTEMLDQFMTVLSLIGGKVLRVADYVAIEAYLRENPYPGRMVTSIPTLYSIAEPIPAPTDPHALANVELAIISGEFGVAENGAIWVTEANFGQRVAPFICQHLAVVLPVDQFCANMHQAYQRLQGVDYGFGVFIAGPSKTADIEQSLVLGAHGARTMTAFLIDN
ncbi:LutC/YkgG family protein [Haliscomenobacter hydrossis]|uniref:Lactate utilization protein B/C n=1 Tax=Haliscomenobacter hydrossis (strain ATCC 27775 / DSM 1100 / LMG 10767 / O) TaxID=760192 RepID=F4L1C4_HALH1|nr:LUD domain-containing protein [Haliscomenobacter hydrossis]AEE53821.1 Lactate utilization protein B/C [Haliscomenobacter hydrossis DSM 1100]